MTDRTETLDRVIAHYNEKFNIIKNKKDDETSNRMGLYSKQGYFNAVMGNFFTFIRSGEFDDYIRRAKDFFDYSDYDMSKIREKLNELSDYAKKVPAEPELVTSWAEYRSDLGGTLESWYSNRESKQNDVTEQLKVCRKLLGEIYESLSDDSGIKEGILKETIEIIDTASARIDRAFTNELESYLATLRNDLNEYMQQNKDVKLPKDWQKNLSKHIQSSPLFFGENKLALWEQLKNLKALIREDLEKLEVILQGDFESYEITDKQVDMLAQLYNRITNGGNREVVACLKNIEKELGVKFTDRNDRATFNLTGYERGRYKELKIPNPIQIARLKEMSKLGELYKEVKNAPQDDYNLRDVAQLSKVVVAAIVRGSEKEREVNLLHSNLSGYANLISRDKFISRYQVQAVNGAQNLLAYNENGRYFYKFDDDKFADIEKRDVSFAKQGNNFSIDSDVWTKSPQIVPVMAVQSSRYQVQFLDWFFGKHQHKKCRLSAGGSFTIAEKACRINWRGNEPEVVDEKNDRLFVSQPFTINPPETRLADSEKIKNRFVGVDIGEYGLAWSLIEINGNEVNQLESGFIADNQQLTLKKDVKDLRERQVRATFNSPDTKVARVRESLIGSYRNLLEDLAMRKNARLSFEYEVSGFETGGNRISKVYDSIKRGSVARKENNSENKQAWGNLKNDEFIWKAVEATAAGTSQFCTKCKNWASLDLDESRDYTLEDYQDGLFKIELNSGRSVRLFAPNNSAGDTLKGKDIKTIKSMIYKAMRPNDDGAGMEIVKRLCDWEQLSQDFGSGKKRGNIGIYVCPYIDCHHVSDADLQAAFSIAIRGAAKANPEQFADEGESKDGKWKEGILTKEKLCDLEKNLIFAPINVI